MDEKNYVTASLVKPMGIVFEENDADVGGIFVLSLSEGGAAATAGNIQAGDQLIAVNDKKVSGMTFDDALGTIVASETPATQLMFFRGKETQFYGPTGASTEWVEEFIANKTP
jgi:C-terminal processing protease CtpA/Prc